MRKKIGGLVALLALAATTVAVSVAQAGSAAAASSSAGDSPYCFGQTPFSPVAALKAAGGDVRRDRVPNQHKLEPTKGDPSPFAPLATINVTVYFHVIRSAADANAAHGDIPDQWITDQMAQLNNAYSGGEGGTDMHVHFIFGGTDRTTNATWFGASGGVEDDVNAEFAMKSQLRRGDYSDLNVYTVDMDTYLGWAYFPEKKPSADDATFDGVVIYHQSLPGGNATGNGGTLNYHGGDTLTHEAGHWLGLYHTFEDWGTGDGCKGKGDMVSDTPAEFDPDFFCDASDDSCLKSKGLDPVHNYMDYGDDTCLSQFTAGQQKRVSSLWKTRLQKPVVTDFTPLSGDPGDTVTINGRFLSHATNVLFGKTAASFAIVSDGQLTATVPAGTKKVKVSVVTPNGSASAKDKFAYNPV